VATWKVSGTTQKANELKRQLQNRRTDIAAICEIKKTNEGPIQLENYVTIFSRTQANN
jgi:hypothetical protein